MALPRVNEVLNFTMTIPSTGQTVKYRPYLVKEEKVLLQAFESRDTKACLQAMCDTISSCLDQREEIDTNKLATFDIEYMFTQLRAKSVGEASNIMINCSECEHQNPYSVDLDAITVEVPRGANIIAITDDIKVEMQYPTYASVLEGDLDAENADMQGALDVVARSIAAVHTEDERIDCTTQSKEEIDEFISSMTATQLNGLTTFIQELPALQHDVEFKCVHCGAENTTELKGLADFF